MNFGMLFIDLILVVAISIQGFETATFDLADSGHLDMDPLKIVINLKLSKRKIKRDSLIKKQ